MSSSAATALYLVEERGEEKDNSTTVLYLVEERGEEKDNMAKGKVGNKTDSEPPTYQEATGNPGYEEMQVQFSWDDAQIRRVFIRKVYAILMLQLLVTLGIVALFTFCAPVRFYIQTHPGLYSLANLTFLATYIALSCCGDLRRQHPTNIILLVIFTLSLAFIMGFMSSFYNTRSVMLCVGITALVCLSITLFSFQSKVDFTSCQGVLFCMCMSMLFCAIALSIVVPLGFVPWLHAIYATMGAMLFTLFLAFDTQLLIGNKRYTLSPEEYVYATLNIYLDIIYLFSFMLACFGGGRE